MREIKFRAWDNENKIMVTEKNVQDIISEYRTDDVYYPTEWWPASEILAIFDYFQDVLDYPHMQVMQYTGLKDKNGVEIYEGDICDVTHNVCSPDEIDLRSVVRFGKGEFYFDSGTDDPAYDVSVSALTYECENGYCFWKAEVIGNIYENPELIE